MNRMLVARFSIALVDRVFGFNPLPVAPVHGAPRVQPRTAPNGVGPVMQTMPDRRSYSFPATPAGPSGSSFLPPMASADPALSATQQGQETAPMVAAPMQADDDSWHERFIGFAAGVLASLSGFAAAFLTYRSRIGQRSSPTPQRDGVELRQTPFLFDPSP